MSESTLPPHEPTDRDIKEAAVSGVRWMAGAKVMSDGLSFLAAVALARMIAPAEFGNAAVALILVPLSVIATYEGFGSALVQRKTVELRHLQAATLISMAAGVVLSVLTFTIGAPLAGRVLNAEIGHLIRLISPIFAIAAIGTVSRALLSRDLNFRAITLIETLGLVLGAAASVCFALGGLDAEAIVLGGLVQTAVASVVLVIVKRPPLPGWHPAELREITRFGAPASAAGVLYVAITNVDYAVLAARLSATQVGLYWRAFQLGVAYQDKISGIMLRLAFPIYSRTRDQDEMKALHERATRIHGAVVVPLLSILIVTAPDVVPLLFGPAWEPAVAPAQVLAVAGMIAAILTGYSQVMLAAGRPRPLMVFNCCVLVIYGAAVWVTAPYGLVAVAVAVVGVHVAMLVAVYGVLFRLVLKMPIGRLVTDLAPAVVGGALVVAVGMPLANAMRDAGVAAVPLIAAISAVGAIVHLGALRSLFPAVWADLFMLIRRLLPARERFRRPALSSSAS
jgi:O-antigen/teichoic acid export membrane protein